VSDDSDEGNATKLVIVESPAKARTINRILGRGFQVTASMGHVRDLPPKDLGVDLEHDFQPTYEVLSGRKKTVSGLKKKASAAAEVYLATDLDREGEAIAWHLKEALELPEEKVRRVTFHEITGPAIRRAFAEPRQLDMHKVNAQQARRILDRIVGYQLSPLLWEKVRRGLSAGRVQSVAVRLIVEREREVRNFRSEEYWKITAQLTTPAGETLAAELTALDGEKPHLATAAEAERVVEALHRSTFRVRSFTEAERLAQSPPPLITSLLQQRASIELRFSTSRTMRLAQQLYEGVPLGDEGPVGLITYMRTDSFQVAQSAIYRVREVIGQEFGAEFVPEKPRFYRSRPGAQAAHEAIRPTDPGRTPAEVRRHLEKPLADLYELIWRRFLASQMSPAVWRDRKVEAVASAGELGEATFTAEGKELLFAGYLRALGGQDKDSPLPVVAEGVELAAAAIDPSQHFTQPPPRYSEATLVAELERQGIGRPSTYAPIIATIQERGYVELLQRRFQSTPLGELVTDKLVAHFPDIMNVAFTKQMEEDLDKVEEGDVDWVAALREFNEPFQADLAKAKEEMKAAGEEPVEGVTCERCGAAMVYKLSRGQRFLSCSRYPECTFTRPVDEAGNPIVLSEEVHCDLCGGKMRPRSGRRGPFLACENYPACKFTRPLPEEEARRKQLLEKLFADGRLPACDKCGQPMDLKMGPRGPFLGCSTYPKCTFTMSIRKAERKREESAGGASPPSGGKTAAGDEATGEPAAETVAEGSPCPRCGKLLVLRTGRKGEFLGCSGYPECTYTKNVGRERRQGKRGGLSPAKAKPSGETCEKCGKPMVIRAGRWGPFLACSGYPQCRNTKRMPKEDKAEPAEKPEKRTKALPADKPTELTCPRCGQPLAERRRGLQKYRVCTSAECSYREPITKPPTATGVPCPQAGCDGELVERRGRWGKFFGCSNYPRCRYMARELPDEVQDTGSRPPESSAPKSASGKSRPAARRTRKPRPSAGQA
jgi:DNA topoisomerase-1